MGESFTDYQRWMWHLLEKCGVCRYHIEFNEKKGRYVINQGPVGPRLFWILWTNNLCKIMYHVLTYHGLTGVEVHFLDQMAMWNFFSVYIHVFIECMVWFFKYPMWENLYLQWELQEAIYRKLGKPREAARKITRTDRINFVLYGGICLAGTFSLAFQFFIEPKVVLSTYAMIEADTFFLRVIFCLHECLFICHGYAYQSFTMVLAESYAVSWQHLLEEMNQALGSIILKAASYKSQKTILGQNGGKLRRIIMEGRTPRKPVWNLNLSRLTHRKSVDPSITAPGTEYDLHSLVEDYRKVIISAKLHNQWIGKVMGFAELINYAQFVSDVFMMIQLLLEPNVTLLGVVFFFMDAVFGMIMIFRMLILLSRLYPQGEEFIQGLKVYACFNSPLRKELMKTIPSLTVVSAKLSGMTIRPESVPSGIDVLINWYICAAMWKRPDDPSRRT